ncbi:MAG: TlpA family protein disulfide reductase [Solirubrobacteraceae bacterium]
MSSPEPADGGGFGIARNPMKARNPRYGRYAGLLGVVLIVLVVVDSVFVHHTDVTGVPPGQKAPPFAVPLALGNLNGAADVATHANEGAEGRVPACAERGAQILNVCQLDERGPVVLALFVDAGSCTTVLGEMQALVPEFPSVRFAAVAIRDERGPVRRLIRARGLTLPVGLDFEGGVAARYKVFSCPQVDFVYPGGVVQSKALLASPSLASLRARVSELVAASRARERREPAA